MYLTRFRMNTGRSGARRLLASPHLMHGAVNTAFPAPPPRTGEQPRVLWRVDRDHQADAKLYIVSPDRPDLTHLVEQAGWPALEPQGWDTFGYAQFLDALAEGDTWGFRLTANPVHNIRRQRDSREQPTKRAAHRTPRYQMEWLLKRQEPSGFEIVRKPADRQLTPQGDEYELAVLDQLPLQFRRTPAARGGNDVRITRATFEGRLRITDLSVFRRVLTHGLGKAKAYGCGLLTLAPVGAR